jgi:transposase-like protein
MNNKEKQADVPVCWRPGDPGKPSFLEDPDFRAEFLKHASTGLPIRGVCQLMMINETTYQVWRNKAEEGMEPYASFIAQVKAARQKDASLMLEKARRFIEQKEDPRMALKYLSQVHKISEERQIKKQVEVSGGLQIAPAFDTSKLSDAEFQQWCALVDKMNPARKVSKTEDTEPILISDFSSEAIPQEPLSNRPKALLDE